MRNICTENYSTKFYKNFMDFSNNKEWIKGAVSKRKMRDGLSL